MHLHKCKQDKEVNLIDPHYILSWTFPGLFQPSHMKYEAMRHSDRTGEPSLGETVEKSIDILSRNTEHGYFLYVESNDIHEHVNTCMHTISSSRFVLLSTSLHFLCSPSKATRTQCFPGHKSKI